jgi:hypothetical protein
MNRMYGTLIASLCLSIPGAAQQQTQRANITGNAVDGKCTIEIVVDGAAEVEVQGDVGRLRTLSGQPATWRRFVCNGLMPANPQDFRFRGIDGRGDVQLVQDPRQTGGRIVFQVNDPQGGREGYTVDLEWRGSAAGQWNSQDSRGWQGPGSRSNNPIREQRFPTDGRGPGGGADYRDQGPNLDRRYYDERGRWNAAGTARAVSLCEAAAAQRIEQQGFRNVSFRDVVRDDNPGRNDSVSGMAVARRGSRRNSFQFSCGVNLANGEVRSVQVRRR